MADVCPLCRQRPATVTHHLVFGYGMRELADTDGLVIKVCPECHTLARKPEDRIHDNPIGEKLSKMLGQQMFESKQIAKGADAFEARALFMARYGISFL